MDTRRKRRFFKWIPFILSSYFCINCIKGLAQSFHSKSNFNSVAKEEIRPHFKGVGADFCSNFKNGFVFFKRQRKMKIDQVFQKS